MKPHAAFKVGQVYDLTISVEPSQVEDLTYSNA